jgi:hypothetical protein
MELALEANLLRIGVNFFCYLDCFIIVKPILLQKKLSLQKVGVGVSYFL